jgi:hypothetical protein
VSKFSINVIDILVSQRRGKLWCLCWYKLKQPTVKVATGDTQMPRDWIPVPAESRKLDRRSRARPAKPTITPSPRSWF